MLLYYPNQQGMIVLLFSVLLLLMGGLSIQLFDNTYLFYRAEQYEWLYKVAQEKAMYLYRKKIHAWQTDAFINDCEHPIETYCEDNPEQLVHTCYHIYEVRTYAALDALSDIALITVIQQNSEQVHQLVMRTQYWQVMSHNALDQTHQRH